MSPERESSMNIERESAVRQWTSVWNTRLLELVSLDETSTLRPLGDASRRDIEAGTAAPAGQGVRGGWEVTPLGATQRSRSCSPILRRHS
jgi:hypothetical protein